MPTRWVVLLGLVGARMAFAFQLQSLAAVAPGLMRDMALDAAAIGTLVGLYSLPGLALAIPGAMLSRRLGERRFLAGCLLAMAAGGALCGLAEGYWTIWFGRLIGGLGAVGINVAMTKIVVDWFAERELATAMAIFLGAFPAGIALALVTLGGLTDSDDWRWSFLATAVVSLLALAAFLPTYRARIGGNPNQGKRPRLTGGELGMVSLSGAIWALYNAIYMVVVGFVPLLLIARGVAADAAASLVGLGVWVTIVAVPLGGVIADRLRRPNLLISSGVLLWGGGLLLVLPWSGSTSLLALLLVATSLLGALPAGPIVALASEVLRPESRSTGMGVFYTWLYGGHAFGPMLAGYLHDTSGEPAAPLLLVTALSVATVALLGLFRMLQAQGRPAVLHLAITR